MKRSSKMVPFVIIVTMIVIISVVVLLNLSAPEVLREYDVLGITRNQQVNVNTDDVVDNVHHS